MAEPSCTICFSTFNKTTRKCISCAYCSTTFCRGCIEQYVLTQGISATCPSLECRLPWSEEFMDEHMTVAFRNGALATHKKKYLCDREKARLPELQGRARLYTIIEEKAEPLIAEYSAKIEEIDKGYIYETLDEYEAQIENINKEVNKILYQSGWGSYNSLYSSYYNGEFSPGKLDDEVEIERRRDSLPDEISKGLFDKMVKMSLEKQKYIKMDEEFRAAHRQEVHELHTAREKLYKSRRLVQRIVNCIHDTYGLPYEPEDYEIFDLVEYPQIIEKLGYGCVTDGSSTDKPRVVVHCGCPVEGCKGFIGGDWTCGLCSVAVCQTCRDCVVAEGGPHACQKEKVETAALLAKETKACPQCAALIYRSDGCDQMWCTQCHTTFSWRTGQKEEGRVHNPHYYEWMRRTQGSVPREPGDEVPGACAEDGLREFSVAAYINVAAGRPFLSKEALFADVDPVWRVEAAERIEAIHRMLTEIREYNFGPAARRDIDRTRMRDLDTHAVLFLADEISEEKWQSVIFSVEKEHAYRTTEQQIFEMFYNAGRDILNSISAEAPIGSALKQVVELVAFTNEEARKMNKRFDKKGVLNFIGIFAEPLEDDHGVNLRIFKKEKSDRWYRAYVDNMLLAV